MVGREEKQKWEGQKLVRRKSVAVAKMTTVKKNRMVALAGREEVVEVAKVTSGGKRRGAVVGSKTISWEKSSCGGKDDNCQREHGGAIGRERSGDGSGEGDR